MTNQSKLKAKTMKKIVLVMVVVGLCSLNLSAGELEDNIKKCDGGDAQTCLKVSDAYFSMDENHPKRSEFHEKACNLKNADGCMLVGFSYEKKAIWLMLRNFILGLAI